MKAGERVFIETYAGRVVRVGRKILTIARPKWRVGGISFRDSWRNHFRRDDAVFLAGARWKVRCAGEKNLTLERQRA